MSEHDEALAAARRMLGPIEPDGSYAVDGFFKDATLVARALLSSPQAEDVRREALEEAARIADAVAVNRARVSGVAEHACRAIATRIRCLASKETER